MIEVEYPESDILCTIALLKAMRAEGVIGTPVAVNIAGQEGWRRVAIQYLDEMGRRKQLGLPLRHPHRIPDRSQWAELNEEFDFNERKANDGKLVRELRANT